MGYDQNLSGPGPTGAYFFYYINQPEFPSKGMSLRLALAPTYVDSELAVASALGENTDVGLGLAGGGFADSYAEVRRGHYFREESFNGHGGNASLNIYHLFNPKGLIPLSAVMKLMITAATYNTTANTRSDFALPPETIGLRGRYGLRLGGEPPQLMPPRAAEFSIWYEGRWRKHPGNYGFDGDRSLASRVDLFWSRAKIAWRRDSGTRYQAAVEAGTSRSSDRLDCYRLGGFLPFASEFPLSIPGYFNGELSARRFALLSGAFSKPVRADKRLSAQLFASVANVSYLEGMGQPKPWNRGVGGGLVWDSPKRVWRIGTGYAYGIDAMRGTGRGAHSASVLVQLDLEAWQDSKAPHPHTQPVKTEPMDWLFQIFKP
jgi:hypothetical protein